MAQAWRFLPRRQPVPRPRCRTLRWSFRMDNAKQIWKKWAVPAGLLGILLVTVLKTLHVITLGEWQTYCGAIGAFCGLGMHFGIQAGTADKTADRVAEVLEKKINGGTGTGVKP